MDVLVEPCIDSRRSKTVSESQDSTSMRRRVMTVADKDPWRIRSS